MRKSSYAIYKAATPAKLQWGRNFIVAEMVSSLAMATGVRKLQWGRNFIVAEITRISWQGGMGTPLASMGPQLYRCGNKSPGYVMNPDDDKLQWGRNFIVAETCGSATCTVWFLSLQWGRNFIVAETWLHDRGDVRGVFTLQWGRNFIVAEIRPIPNQRLRSHSASMGPQLYRCGNDDTLEFGVIHGVASMGPQLYRCGNPQIRAPSGALS